jgi:hypothetical protein
VGLLEGVRGRAVTPGKRAENLLAGSQAAASDRPRALEPEIHVGAQPELRLPVHRADLGLAVAIAGVAPDPAVAPVVERGLAIEEEVHRPAQAPSCSQQDLLGLTLPTARSSTRSER